MNNSEIIEFLILSNYLICQVCGELNEIETKLTAKEVLSRVNYYILGSKSIDQTLGVKSLG